MSHTNDCTRILTLFCLVAPLAVTDLAAQYPECAAANAGLTLPDGFCALVVADGVGRARHLTVAANGDVFVALGRTRGGDGGGGGGGGVLALRDTTGDGVADVQVRFSSGPGDDVQFRNGYLY